MPRASMHVPQTPTSPPRRTYTREHVGEVVVPLRHLLPGGCTSRSIAQQKHLNFRSVLRKQRPHEPQRVVGALGPIRGVVQNEERLHARPEPRPSGRGSARWSMA